MGQLAKGATSQQGRRGHFQQSGVKAVSSDYRLWFHTEEGFSRGRCSCACPQEELPAALAEAAKTRQSLQAVL